MAKAVVPVALLGLMVSVLVAEASGLARMLSGKVSLALYSASSSKNVTGPARPALL